MDFFFLPSMCTSWGMTRISSWFGSWKVSCIVLVAPKWGRQMASLPWLTASGERDSHHLPEDNLKLNGRTQRPAPQRAVAFGEPVRDNMHNFPSAFDTALPHSWRWLLRFIPTRYSPKPSSTDDMAKMVRAVLGFSDFPGSGNAFGACCPCHSLDSIHGDHGQGPV